MRSWIRCVLLAVIVAGCVERSAMICCADEPAAVHEEAAGHGAAAAHGDAASHGSPDPLSVDPDLAIWTAVIFVMLLLVLSKFAWGPIVAGLEKREHTIANHMDEAARKHEEAKQLLLQHEQRLAGAAAEIKALMDEAHRDAEATRATILAEAKQAAEAERARALRDIETATDASLKQLAEHSANLAVELAGKILSTKLTKEDHARLVRDVVNRLPDTSLN